MSHFLGEFYLTEREVADHQREVDRMGQIMTVSEVETLRFMVDQPWCSPIRRAVINEQLRRIDEEYILNPRYGIGGAYLGGNARREFEHGPPAKVNIKTLRPGDAVKVNAEDLTFLGMDNGKAIVSNSYGVFEVSPDLSNADEARPLPTPIDRNEFERGYQHGWQKGVDEHIAGDQKVGNIPTDFGRGFVAGHADGINGNYRQNRNAPINEATRQGEKYAAGHAEWIMEHVRRIMQEPSKANSPFHFWLKPCPITGAKQCHSVWRADTATDSWCICISTMGFDRIWLRSILVDELQAIDESLSVSYTTPIVPNPVPRRQYPDGTHDTYVINI